MNRKRVVITGGIGSGKSTVSSFLASRGWTILDADSVGHQVLGQPEVVEAVARRWSHAIHDGVVDRRRLGQVVFESAEDLKALERITHPLISHRIEDWWQSAPPRSALEISVLHMVPPGSGPVVVVDAPDQLRLDRVVERGLQPSEALARLRNQPSRQMWLEAADIVVSNGGSLEALSQAVTLLANALEK